MDAEFVLNEGGAIVAENGKVRQINISYADKVSVTIRVRTSGKTGHSSRPLPIDVTANGQLISALDRLQHYSAPIQLTAEARSYFAKLAGLNPGPLAASIDRLLTAPDKVDQDAAAEAVMAAGEAGWGVEGLLHNTLVVMMITAGFKANAMPNQAEAVLNARLMPGTDVDAFLEDLRRTIGNPRVDLEIVSALPKDQVTAYFRERVAIKSSTLDTDLYRAIERSAARTWPGAPVLPTLLVAGTDATPWRKRGIPVYGISPFPIEPGDPTRVHGNDERVNLAGIDKGSDYIYRIVVDVARH
jgi:acetylornithine deacetylase/succinyl-diaminopimelate desuccinylase-like protein